MPISPFVRAMADDPAAFQRVLDWWGGGSRGEPPHLTFRAEDFGMQSVKRQPKPLPWSRADKGTFIVTASASAGIDSTAAVLKARERWPNAPMLLVRADTGFEPEDSDMILRTLARKVGAATVTLLAYEDLYDLIRATGRIPNPMSDPWCSSSMKGGRLDRFFKWFVGKRAPKATVHVTGLLGCEPDRILDTISKTGKTIPGHLSHQERRFGDQMLEVAVLLEDKVDKRDAYNLALKHKIPISDTYEVRRRHGCIPCKWWSNQKQWRDFYRTDPKGFMAAADLEEEIARTGKTTTRGPNPVGTVARKTYRIWLLGRARTHPEGLNLREWLAIWDAERPGWRTAPLEFDPLLAPSGLGEPTWKESELLPMPKKRKKKGRSSRGRPALVTAGTDETNAPGTNRHTTRWDRGTMPAQDLLGLKGSYGEHRRFANDPTGGYGTAKWAAFLDDIRRNGVTGTVDIRVWWTDDLPGDVKRMLAGKGTWSLPPMPGEILAPVEAFIYEGNHRARAAAELGLEVPVQITYYGHAEKRVDLRRRRRARQGRGNKVRRVAFDFDGTLTLEDADAQYLGPNPRMIAKLRDHAARGDEVWIVTARSGRARDKAASRRGHRWLASGHPRVHAFLDEHMLPVAHIVFTSLGAKGPHLKHHGISLIYDDQEGQRQSAVDAGVQALPPEYPR